MHSEVIMWIGYKQKNLEAVPERLNIQFQNILLLCSDHRASLESAGPQNSCDRLNALGDNQLPPDSHSAWKLHASACMHALINSTEAADCHLMHSSGRKNTQCTKKGARSLVKLYGSDGNRNSRVLILVSCIGVKLSLLTLELCISWCLLTKTRFKRFVTAISFTCNHWQVPKRKFRVYRYVDKKALVDRCHSIESRRRHLRQRITPLHFRPIYQKI